jgi:GT2 family glycosyltransferase
MDQVQTEFAQSLFNLQRVGNVYAKFLQSSLLVKSRTDLGLMAVQEKADYILWIDSDMVFPDTLLIDLMADMETGKDIVAGVCHMRREPYKPVLWSKLRQGLTAFENESESLVDYPRDGLFEVEGVGFGCIMMKTEVIAAVRDKYADLFGHLPGYGEDLSFCIRARGCGYRIWVDPKIQVGHKSSIIVDDTVFQAFRKKLGDADLR